MNTPLVELTYILYDATDNTAIINGLIPLYVKNTGCSKCLADQRMAAARSWLDGAHLFAVYP